MQSQQLSTQGHTYELPTSSKQQPGSLTRSRPIGVQAGSAALVLAALSFSLVLSYAAACALITRNGYAAVNLRRDIEDLRAQNALLSYQIHLAKSDRSVQQSAGRLNMRPADPVHEVDYVFLPSSDHSQATRLAAATPTPEPAGLAVTLAGLATEVMAPAAGRAEASTGDGHRP